MGRLGSRIALLLALAAAGTAVAPPPSGLVVESLRVAPAAGGSERPRADTVCSLRVTLRNHGTEKASALGFRVEVGGRELPVYRNHLFYHRLDPGQSTEVRLHNFWTTETGRPFPADGKLRVSATLVEAQWMRIEMAEGAEVWAPIQPVAGLPSAQAITVDLAGGRN